MKGIFVVLAVLIIILILMGSNFLGRNTLLFQKNNRRSDASSTQPSRNYAEAAVEPMRKKKVKFENKVMRVDYDKESGEMMPGKITQKINDR